MNYKCFKLCQQQLLSTQTIIHIGQDFLTWQRFTLKFSLHCMKASQNMLKKYDFYFIIYQQFNILFLTEMESDRFHHRNGEQHSNCLRKL